MSFPLLAVFVAAITQFIIGAIWYMPIFGKLWGHMHGFDKLTKDEQEKAQKKMMPLMGIQFLCTVLTAGVFVLLRQGFPQDWNIYGLAFFFWLGFVLPTQIGAVLFGGTEPRFVVKKTAIMAGGALACLMGAAFVLSMMA
jgi:hypothetical protein